MKNKENKEKQKSAEISAAVQNVINTTPIANTEILSDVFGSYTGVPLDGGEPVQDADDL